MCTFKDILPIGSKAFVKRPDPPINEEEIQRSAGSIRELGDPPVAGELLVCFVTHDSHMTSAPPSSVFSLKTSISLSLSSCKLSVLFFLLLPSFRSFAGGRG